MRTRLSFPTVLSVALALPFAVAAAQPATTAALPAAGSAARPALVPLQAIVAIVNGDVISSGDVENRGRLFALSTGLPVSREVLDRLRPQVIKQLVDERLRLQEVQRRKIVVNDAEIAEAIGDIEQRNGMASGGLRRSLEGQNVALRTLIDQVRVQLGWTRVLRQELGEKAEVSDVDAQEQIRLLKGQVGQTEVRLGEIFIPVDDPAKASEAERFADTVIAQLRAGAPFPVVAAQFSQSQTALQGGDLGWVRRNQLDPAVAAVAQEMPPGAVSNPIDVPGGISIITLRAKREIGRDQATVMSIRQVFVPFVGALNPNAPTEQQRKAVEQAQAVSRSAKSCKDMEEANGRFGNVRPSDPGEVRLETVSSGPLRSLLSGLKDGVASKPVVANEGAAVLMVCSREQKNAAAPSKEEVGQQLLQERVELASRQLQRDLRRRATLDERSVTAGAI